jgi:hypothetical protein
VDDDNRPTESIRRGPRERFSRARLFALIPLATCFGVAAVVIAIELV